MSTVNFNDTTPAPTASNFNIAWQSDATGNISAHYPQIDWNATTGAAAILNRPPLTVAAGTVTVTGNLTATGTTTIQTRLIFSVDAATTAWAYLAVAQMAFQVDEGTKQMVIRYKSSSGANWSANILLA